MDWIVKPALTIRFGNHTDRLRWWLGKIHRMEWSEEAMALCHATVTGLSTLLTLPISNNQQKPRDRSRGCFSLISKKKNMKGMLFVQRFYKGKHPFVKHGQVSNVPDCPKSMARLLPSTLLDTETTWTAFPPCVHFGCSCLHSYKYIHMLMTT